MKPSTPWYNISSSELKYKLVCNSAAPCNRLTLSAVGILFVLMVIYAIALHVFSSLLFTFAFVGIISVVFLLLLVVLQKSLAVGCYLLDGQGCLYINANHFYQIQPASRILPLGLILVVDEYWLNAAAQQQHSQLTNPHKSTKLASLTEPVKATEPLKTKEPKSLLRNFASNERPVKRHYFVVSKSAMSVQDYRRLARAITMIVV